MDQWSVTVFNVISKPFDVLLFMSASTTDRPVFVAFPCGFVSVFGMGEVREGWNGDEECWC